MKVPLDLDAFCHKEYPRLVGTLTLFCGDRDVATELAQEALARACAHWRKVRKMEAPGPWLNRVAINLAKSHFRRRKTEQRLSEQLSTRRDERETYEDPAMSVDVRRAVAALPVRQRTAIIYRYFLSLSVSETAQMMECPEGTVKRLTHEAISALQQNPTLQIVVEGPNGG